MKVLITGDSHTGVLRRSKAQLETEGHWSVEIDLTILVLGGARLLATEFFQDCGSYVKIIDETCRKRFERFPSNEQTNDIPIYGISGVLHSTRIWRNEDWQIFAPYPIHSNKIPISMSMLNRIVLDDQKYLLAFVDILTRVGAKVFVIEPPYPFRHHPLFQKIRSDVIHTVNVTYRNIIRSELSRRSIPIVSVPRDCIDDEGFMLEKYRSERPDDVHHGNLVYGRLMMLEILSFLLNWNDSTLG